jgi:transcriptional antiterminator RfaH
MTANSAWFLLQTKAREEQRAIDNLNQQQITTFCPEITVEKIVRGKRKTQKEVLFPGYIFVRLDAQSPSFTTIRSTRGVAKFVTFGHEPSRVPDTLIDIIQQRIADQDCQESAKPAPKPGDLLEITEGAFKGMDAIFSEPDGDARAIVLVTIMHQLVPTSIANQHLKTV